MTVSALNKISIDFDEKGLVFLIGKSGSGKTTLLNLIGGLDAPTSGEIIVGGRSSSSFSEEDFDCYRNTYVGFVFQEYNLIEDYTVGVNIGIALELQGRRADRQEIDALLRRVDLIDSADNTLYDRRIAELSGGQKQRVAIARALIKNPKIILADEPTGALDSETGAQLYELLKELSKGKLIIVISHDIESAERYGDRIIELHDGEAVRDTAPAVRRDKTDDKPINFIKSHLPIKRSVAISVSALKNREIRMALSILLSVITFIVFGVSLVASSTDEYVAEIRTMYDHGNSMLAIHFPDYYSILSLNEIIEYNNNSFPMFLISDNTSFREYLGEAEEDKEYTVYESFASYYLAELDPDTGLSDANLKADGRFLDNKLCRLPQTMDEIAITDYWADMFMRFGYREADGTITKIITPDDLIGKKLDNLSISGVYSTELNLEDYKEYDTVLYNNDYYITNLMSGVGQSIITYRFVCKGYGSSIGKYNINSVLIKLSGDLEKDMELIFRLSESGDTFKLASAYSFFVSWISFFRTHVLNIVMTITGIFAALSALIMMNYLTVSISFRKKELGILRALGARKKDITLICLIESLIIASVDFIISLVMVIIICAILNSAMFISVLNFGFVQIGLLFLLCFGVAALATILPVWSVAKRKSLDIINGK